MALVVAVCRVLVCGDAFCKRGSDLEEDGVEYGSHNGPVDNAAAGRDGEEVEAPPAGYLGEEVRVARPRKEAGLNKTVLHLRESAGGCLGLAFLGRERFPLCLATLESVLLVVSNRLYRDAGDHADCGDDVEQGERSLRAAAGQPGVVKRRGNEGKEQCQVTDYNGVGDDEEHLIADDVRLEPGVAVVEESRLVITSSCRVRSEADTPNDDETCH